MKTILHSSNDKSYEVFIQFSADFGCDYMVVIVLGMEMI